MATFFRIVQERWAASAVDGEGARLFGGRWNPPGVPAIYLAESRALAALEILVHAPREALHLEWRLLEVTVPDELMELSQPAELPKDWQMFPSSPGARNHGGRWLGTGALALKLPSVLIPQESVLLVNPQSAEAGRMKVKTPQVFRFDMRL